MATDDLFLAVQFAWAPVGHATAAKAVNANSFAKVREVIVASVLAGQNNIVRTPIPCCDGDHRVKFFFLFCTTGRRKLLLRHLMLFGNVRFGSAATGATGFVCRRTSASPGKRT